MQHFHKLHHTYKQPTAFSVTAIHPVEFLNIQAIYIAPMFLMKIYARKISKVFLCIDIVTQLSTASCCSIFTITGSLTTRGLLSRYSIIESTICEHQLQKEWWQPWQPDCIFHDNHHQYFHVNFGFNIEFWDHFHGTARLKGKIYREDIFWGKGKDITEASK